jgi:hypothetical protein
VVVGSGAPRVGPLPVDPHIRGDAFLALGGLALGLLALGSGVLFAAGLRKLRVVLTRDAVRIEGAYRPVEVPYRDIHDVRDNGGEIVLVLAGERRYRIDPYLVRPADRIAFQQEVRRRSRPAQL